MNRNLKLVTLVSLVSVVAMAGANLMQDGNPMVGGATMGKKMNIVENAIKSPVHKTLVAAVKQAGLVNALMGKGPFTVFAPTDDAFENVDPSAVKTLMMDENKKALAGVLTYHVIPGHLDMMEIGKRIKAGHGMAKIKTLNGGSLMFKWNGPKNVVVGDAKGGWANISIYDVQQSNGVIHVVDRVLMP